MSKYHNPKTGKTVEAKNLKEALEKMKPVVSKKPKKESNQITTGEYVK